MSKTKTDGLTFLKKAEGSESTKTVSARVPASVFASFQNAADVAARNGYELSITEVITAALQAATKEARKQFGESAFQTSLPLSDKPSDKQSDKKEEVKPATVPATGNAKPVTTAPAVNKTPEPAKK